MRECCAGLLVAYSSVCFIFQCTCTQAPHAGTASIRYMRRRQNGKGCRFAALLHRRTPNGFPEVHKTTAASLCSIQVSCSHLLWARVGGIARREQPLVAVHAAPAGDVKAADHSISFLKVCHLRPDVFHNPHEFVSQHIPRHHPRHGIEVQVQVGATDGSAGDAQDDVILQAENGCLELSNRCTLSIGSGHLE